MIDDGATLAGWAGMWALIGLAVGSFLNVVIWRVPRKESVVAPPSHCPDCDARLRWRDNVPVLSWLALRGKCHACGEPISARYPLVELTTGALFAAAAVRFEATWQLAGFLLLFATLFAVAIIDLEHYIVPNRIVFPVAGASIVLLAGAAAADGHWGDLGRALAGSGAAFGGLLVVHLISPAGMGMGDVKLAFILGLFLGWLGWGHVALGLFLGFFLGAVLGVALVGLGIRSRKQHIPFAPFLGLGTVIAVLWGGPVLDWYARF